MKTQVIELNGNFISVYHVHFIGTIDVTINHGLQHASKIYWFPVVVGGQTVRISANSKEEAEILRLQLINAVST